MRFFCHFALLLRLSSSPVEMCVVNLKRLILLKFYSGATIRTPTTSSTTTRPISTSRNPQLTSNDVSDCPIEPSLSHLTCTTTTSILVMTFGSNSWAPKRRQYNTSDKTARKGPQGLHDHKHYVTMDQWSTCHTQNHHPGKTKTSGYFLGERRIPTEGSRKIKIRAAYLRPGKL